MSYGSIETPKKKKRLGDLKAELGLDDDAVKTKLEGQEKLTLKDVYAILAFLVISPITIVSYFAIAIYLLPIRLPSILYVKYLRSIGVREYIPTTTGFYIFTTIESVLVLPVIAVAFVYFILVQVYAFVVFAPVGFLTGVDFKKNVAVVKGVGEGLGSDVFWIFSFDRIYQLWRCLYGMHYRISFWEWVMAISWMTMMNPVIKYFFTTNIWLWTLEEKWCSQWTGGYGSIPRADVKKTFVKCISYAFFEDSMTRKEIDNACFCAHYAMPPPNRDTNCLGMQYVPSKYSTNLALTRHWHMMDTENHSPLSETGVETIHEVNLHYSNAWHFLTGYVECNLQFECDGNQIEHPMWIIMPTTGYIGFKLYKKGNELFEEFAPELHSTILRKNGMAK